MRKLTRRDALKALGLGVVGGGALRAAKPQAARPQAGERPNFIVIFTDDQGYGDLSCFGSKTIRSPHLDGMAAEGMKFTSFYVAAAVCTPSRAALMTGCYPPRVGLPRVHFPHSMPQGQIDGKAYGINPAEVTIAEVLKAAGYATACFGKWHLGNQKPFLPTNHGFDEYFGLPYSNDMHLPYTKFKFPPLPVMCGEKVLEYEPNQNLLTRRYTEHAVKFIQRNKDRPFFLYLPHSMPHRPIHVSAPFRERFTEKQMNSITDKNSRDFLYPGAIEEIDGSCGEILNALKAAGVDKRTLVLFTSDNGPSAGSAGPLRGGKGSAFEGGMRVPCIVRWPDGIPAGRVCDEIATAMDLLPTFAALAGGKAPTDRIIDGKDIGPLLRGEAGATTPHEAFYYHRGTALSAMRSGKWKLHFKGAKKGGGLQPGALYDLDADIAEKTNLAARNPAVVKRLAALARTFTQQLRKTARPSGRAPITAMPPADPNCCPDSQCP